MSAVLLLIMATETEGKQRGDDLKEFKGAQLNLMQNRFEFKHAYEEVTERNCILPQKSLVGRKTDIIHVFKQENGSDNLARHEVHINCSVFID